MYEWLADSLSDSGTVITANRRLARVLGEEHAAEQLGAGKKAWRSPAVLSRQDWLVKLSDTALRQVDLPTRINAQQSQLLWERCLRKDLQNSEVSIPNLVRLSRDTWQRLADWQVTIGDVARSAQNDDQRLFATVAGRTTISAYLRLLPAVILVFWNVRTGLTMPDSVTWSWA